MHQTEQSNFVIDETNMIRSNINSFKKAWFNSITAQLLIPNLDSTNLELGKESGFLASIAYLAFKRNQLDKLDFILNRFDIRNKATPSFKGKLNENWLISTPDKYRKISHDTISSLNELIVASYLSDNKFSIIDLEAINTNSADIVCEKKKVRYYLEVKYFEDSPQLYHSRIEAFKTSGVSSGTLPNEKERLNYFFYRLAESVIQLQKYLRNNRMVCFIFHELATATGREIFENSLFEFDKWYVDEENNFPSILEKNRETILTHSPIYWLAESNKILIGTLKDFSLEDVKFYKG